MKPGIGSRRQWIGLLAAIAALIALLLGWQISGMRFPWAVGERASVASMPTASYSTTIRPTAIAAAGGQANRLINEKSPYLLLHAHDPVDWYPWGDEAFEKARQENRPIFLSIGYSSCHWCHVMALESFSDPEVARLLNAVFVNVLVDREERPDVDALYSRVAVAMNGTSGWPLNVIMTHDQKPFYITTYIPRSSRLGRIGMLQLIPQLESAWQNNNNQLVNIADEVARKLQQMTAANRGGQLELGDAILLETYEQLVKQFDARNGGFGTSPKFPTAHKLLFLLRYWDRTGDRQALEIVEATLQSMRRGAVYDQVGFGFHRYATDAAWQTPHFEKMLYDQAMLSMVYTEAFQATGKAEYAQTAHEILAYVLRELTAPTGAFYAAEDSDSNAEEGGFYLWTADEIRQILGGTNADLFLTAYHVTDQGNYVDPLEGAPSGRNVLFLDEPLSALARRVRIPEAELRSRLDAARQQLFTRRQGRAALHRDDKILTGWNGLMIAAFARAGQVYDEPDYTQAAQAAADFILAKMINEDGRLLHGSSGGEAGLAADMDDHAFLTWGLMELYEATFEVRYLEHALQFTDAALEHHWDAKDGGFFFTPDDGERLLVRQKLSKDAELPSGNSVEMLNLLRLSRVTVSPRLEEAALDIPRAFALQIKGSESEYTQLMSAAAFAVGPSFEVVIAGEPLAADTQAMLSALRREYIPNKIVLLRPTGDAPAILSLADYLENKTSLDGRATAYVCLDYYCKLPTTSIRQMLQLLNE